MASLIDVQYQICFTGALQKKNINITCAHTRITCVLREAKRGNRTVSEKVVTVSARISGDHLEILERLSMDLELSKTDVIQRALELLGQAGTGSSSSTVTVTIPRDTHRRASRMVHDMGIAPSLPEILQRALDPGLDAVLEDYTRRRQREVAAAKAAAEADAMDIEIAATRTR
jgi:hypothetical protein